MTDSILGDNFKNPKVFNLTGHGIVPRKPVADDGRSIRSRKSNSTDPSSERPGSSGVTRTPTNLELSLNDDMSIDPNHEIIPDLPTSRPQSLKDSLPRGRKLKGSPLSNAYGTENFDGLLSSSPLAQSTPRIRLEPTVEENGRRTLKNVPVDFYSLFDPDTSSVMDVDSVPVNVQTGESFGVHIKRKSSLLRESALGFRCHSKRTKKHPSPDKGELEGMEKILQEHPPFGTSESLILDRAVEAQDETPTYFSSALTSPVLSPRDPNPRVQSQSKSVEKRRRSIGLFPKSDLSGAGASSPDIRKRSKIAKSLIPKPAVTPNTRPRQDNRRFIRDGIFSDSAMDIDELQQNDSTYNIAIRKA